MTSLTTSLILPSASLWRREIVTFLRQRSRVGGTLGTPLVFWILLGCGLASSFRLSVSGADVTGGTDMDSITYLEYSFPGALVLMVLFTAVFATISVIEDRHGGFLQAVLVAPVSRSAIVMGKVMGSSTLVLLQATLFLMIAPLAGIRITAGSLIASLGVLLIVSVALSAMGLWMAWQLDSIQGFHAVMNLVLFPMWLLSGAAFPQRAASQWMRWVMACNPVTYVVAALRRSLDPGLRHATDLGPSAGVSILVTILFAVAMVVLASRCVARGV